MAKNVMIATLLAMLAVLAAVHGANNMNIGTHRPGAVLVRTERVLVAPQRNQVVQRTVQYSGTRNVTLIQAFDQFTNGTGGWANISGGGINQRFATVLLRSSAANRGFNFLVNIYAL